MQRLLAFIATNWVWFTLTLLVVFTALSLTPLPKLPEVPGSDKAHHLIAYAMLIFPAALASYKHLKWLLLFLVLWSGLIELIQPFVNRYGEWLDLLANSVGLLIGVLLGLLLRYWLLRVR